MYLRISPGGGLRPVPGPSWVVARFPQVTVRSCLEGRLPVRPFYEDEYTTLYHGDLREIKEWLTADALCADPPYGRGWKQGSLHAWAPDRKDDSHQGIPGDKTTEVRDTMLQLWGQDRPAIVFGDLMIPPPAGTKQVLVYQKPFDAGRRGAISGYRRDLEAVYLLGKKWESGISTGRGSLLTTCVNMISGGAGLAGEYGHPHAKPLDVLEGLLRNLPPGSVIADPCAGSGTTLLAARNLGLRAIGVEVEEEYASRAAVHLAQQPLMMIPLLGSGSVDYRDVPDILPDPFHPAPRVMPGQPVDRLIHDSAVNFFHPP